MNLINSIRTKFTLSIVKLGAVAQAIVGSEKGSQNYNFKKFCAFSLDKNKNIYTVGG